jgi:LPS export ABC transporter protein LptC
MKLKKSRVVIIILIATIVTAAAVILFLESSKFPKNQLLNIMSDKVDLQVKNVHYTDVGASGMKWEINAESAKYVKNENLVLFDRIRVKLVTSEGRTLVMTGIKASQTRKRRIWKFPEMWKSLQTRGIA